MVSRWTSVCLSARQSYVRPSRISFPDENLSKHQWIFTKLGMCIDSIEIWFEIASGQTSSNFDSYLPETCPYFRFRTMTCVNVKVFLTNLVHALLLRRTGLGLLMGKFCQCMTELSAHDTIMAGYYNYNIYNNFIYFIYTVGCTSPAVNVKRCVLFCCTP